MQVQKVARRGATARAPRVDTAALATVERFDRLPDAAEVSGAVVALLKGVHAKTVSRWVDKGLLPAPRVYSGNVVRFVVGDLRRHVIKESAA